MLSPYDDLMPYKVAVEYWTKLNVEAGLRVIDVIAAVLDHKPAIRN
jgi:hypothetical protein